MKKSVLLSVLSLALLVGATSMVFAQTGHDISQGHYIAETSGNDNDPSYYEHGGGHETAADATSVHDSELSSGDHSDPAN